MPVTPAQSAALAEAERDPLLWRLLLEGWLILVGSLSAAFGAVVQYFFGSSSSSAQKNELLSRMVPPPTQSIT